MSRAGRILIGISGWRYKGWRGSFYPEDLPHRRELEFAAQHFDTIELNGSFYSLQRPQNYKQWHDETPDDFTFAVKGSRYITHMLKLNNAEAPLSNFIAQGLLRLGKKLGPILWQFPPQFAFNPESSRTSSTCCHARRARPPDLPVAMINASKGVRGCRSKPISQSVMQLRFVMQVVNARSSLRYFARVALPWLLLTPWSGRC